MINKNYLYSIRYNPIGYTNCDEYGCQDEGICRCYRIERVDIKSVDLLSITHGIYDQLFKNSLSKKRNDKISNLIYGYNDQEISLYGINRILRINKLYDVNFWCAKYDHSYYGDEVFGIEMNDDVHNSVCNMINEYLSIDTLEEKVKFLLEKEYGHFLNKLNGKKVSIIEVNKNDIFFSQKNHEQNFIKKDLEYYRNYPYIKGVCLHDSNNKWRIIDGYHRIYSSKENIKIIGYHD